MSYCEYINNNLESTIKKTIDLMNINSHSNNHIGIKKVHSILCKYISNLGFNVEFVEEDKNFPPHIVANNNIEGKAILLVGHSDTAHSEQSPFQNSVITDDKIIGPGGYDMKAGIMVFILALESLKNTQVINKIPIKIFIISDEEVGMKRSYNLHQTIANESKYGLVFESGRPDNLIITKRKGVGIFKISCRGKSAHAGNEFWLGKNAILALNSLANNIHNLSSKSKDLTLNIGTFNGGQSPTIVPDYAELTFDMRFTSIDVFNETSKHISKLVEDHNSNEITFNFKKELFLPSMEELPETKHLLDSYGQSFRNHNLICKNQEKIVGGGSSACLLTHFGLSTIDALGPLGENAHTDQEWFSIKSFSEKSIVLANWLSEQN